MPKSRETNWVADTVILVRDHHGLDLGFSCGDGVSEESLEIVV